MAEQKKRLDPNKLGLQEYRPSFVSRLNRVAEPESDHPHIQYERGTGVAPHAQASFVPELTSETYPVNPLKRLERYITAFFKFGRTSWLAKSAHRKVREIEPRVNDLWGRSDANVSRLDEHGHSLHEVNTRLDELAHAFECQAIDLRDDMGAQLREARDALMVLQSECEQDVRALEDKLSDVQRRLSDAQQSHAIEQKASHLALSSTFASLSQRLDSLIIGLAVAPRSQVAEREATVETRSAPHGEGFDAFIDLFYHNLENAYRGSLSDIEKRLRIYVPDVVAAAARCNKPALDIGCGRGEWLGILKQEGVPAFGVDTNVSQLENARAAGLNVKCENALQTLAAAEDASLSVITAFHVVEHLPFDTVAWITREAMRVLAPGGLLIFETPHVANVLVGATTFHTDPTHIKPMTQQVLSVLFETAGFAQTEVRQLNPHDRLEEFMKDPKMNAEVAHLLFGAQDVAVLGRKLEAV